MNQPAPKTATSTGEFCLKHWQCPDTITIAYEYPGNFTVAFTGALNKSINDGGTEFRGTDAMLKIDHSHLAVYPQGVKWKPGTRGLGPEILARSDQDGTIDHVNNFLHCVRTRKTPNASVTVGFEAARASRIGYNALKSGMKTVWNAAQERVVS